MITSMWKGIAAWAMLACVAMAPASGKGKQDNPMLVVASDLLGNYIGILTDSVGKAPIPGKKVKFAGQGWTDEATTDLHGMFQIPMRIGDRASVEASAENGAKLTLDPADFQYTLTPTSPKDPKTNLDEGWKFHVDPPEGFFKPGFDDSNWSLIKVPAHWEMEGFHSVDGVGGYRRTFEAPPGAGRLKLRFEGVYSGAEVWVNGHKVSAHEGGFTAFEIDITDDIRPGPNLLAVRVREHTNTSDNLDKMSQYADFPLAGITRSVNLFRVPDTHICRYSIDTLFEPGRGASVDVFVHTIQERSQGAPIEAQIVGTLRGEDGKVAAQTYSPVTMSIPGDRVHQAVSTIELDVREPHPWTAETPYLYTLTLEVTGPNGLIQRLDQVVGLRETRIKGSQILIDGSPVKIRGTCHHDADPLMGRAVSPERTRQDLDLIKECNLNAVRTSHYPPVPELTEYADKIGLYVEEEADFCWVNVANDLRNAPHIIQLTAEMLARDRNRASVFMWSLCNESDWGFCFDRSHEFVRKVDPTRPTSAATSADTEIATLHNPISLARMERTKNLDKPLLFDEAWCIYQGIFGDVAEMWVDPGIRDYYAAPLAAIYDAMMASKTTQGSQIWCWADDIFCVPGRGLEYGRGTTMSHFIDDQYAMPGRGLVGDAPWGVVDGWRRRKPEFWITKKLQSPIRISEMPIPAQRAGDPIEVPVDNQYDFLDLNELVTTYSIGTESGTLDVDVQPRHRGRIAIPVSSPHVGDTLDLTFKTRAGMLIDEFKIPVGTMASPSTAPSGGGPLMLREVSTLSGNGLEIQGSDFDLVFDRDAGYLRRCFSHGQPTLLELPMIHVLPTDSPQQPMPLRTDWKAKSFKWDGGSGGVHISLAGSYPNFEGGYDVTVMPSGEVDVKSSFTYTGPDRLAREIGMSFSVPRSCDTLHWERRGEWNVYPEDHIGRPVGNARAFVDHKQAVPPTWPWSEDNSPMGSNDFRSTKRNVRTAWIAYPDGSAVQVLSDGTKALRATVDSDRIDMNVNDWYGGTNVGYTEWITNYGKGKLIKSGDLISSEVRLWLRSVAGAAH